MLIPFDEETIIAQCTPKGSGAIALLRISGSHVRSIVSKMTQLPGGKSIEDLPSHTIHYGNIQAHHKVIDHVLFFIMDAPRTFTGQHTIEITCHNNPFIIDEIIATAIQFGARLAQEGEFSKRAFLNGKIDLVQAEAINELIHANTQLALKQSLAQIDGSFSHWIKQLETALIKSLAWCEASFEFLDDETATFGPQIKELLQGLLNTINQLKQTFNHQQHIRQGIKIALIGSVNAGKSSLFNALLNQKRSIVTEIAGTTRDAIEAGVYRNGNYWTLIDTAGLRITDDIVEQEGIKRSTEEAHKADIIILVFDGSKELLATENIIYQDMLRLYDKKIILVHNKADLIDAQNSLTVQSDVKLSGTTKHNIDALHMLIEEKISALFSTIESPFLLNQRQHNLLLSLENKLIAIVDMLESNVQYELVSYHLKDALETISQLSGKTVSEAGLDMVFKEFCVGK